MYILRRDIYREISLDLDRLGKPGGPLIIEKGGLSLLGLLLGIALEERRLLGGELCGLYDPREVQRGGFSRPGNSSIGEPSSSTKPESERSSACSGGSNPGGRGSEPPSRTTLGKRQST